MDLPSDYINGEVDSLVQTAVREKALSPDGYEEMDFYEKNRFLNRNRDFDWREE